MKLILATLLLTVTAYAAGVSVAVAPSFGAGMGPVTYTMTAYDTAGYADITELDWVMNVGPSLSTVNACYVRFTYPSTFSLIADSGSGAASGSPQSNSQCTLNSSAVVTTTGTSLQYTISVTFKPSWVGVRRQWLDAASTTYGNTGVITVGSWTVTQERSGNAAAARAYQNGATYSQDLESFLKERAAPTQFGILDTLGITDSSAMIQLALDQLSGNEMRFPCGSYRADSTLEIHQTGAIATRIIGASKGCVDFHNATGNLIWHFSTFASQYLYLQGPDFEQFSCHAKNCIRVGDYLSGGGPGAVNGPPYQQFVLHPTFRELDLTGTYMGSGNVDPDYESLTVKPANPDTLKAYGVGIGIVGANNSHGDHVTFTGFGVGLENNASDMGDWTDAIWFQSNGRSAQVDTYGAGSTDQFAGQSLGGGFKMHGWQSLCPHRYGGILLDHVGDSELVSGYFENCSNTNALAQSYLMTSGDSFTHVKSIKFTQNLSVPMIDSAPVGAIQIHDNIGSFWYNTGSTIKIRDDNWNFQIPMLAQCYGNSPGFPCPTQKLPSLTALWTPFVQTTPDIDLYEFNPGNMFQINNALSAVAHPWVTDSVTGKWVIAPSYLSTIFPIKRTDDRNFLMHYTARAGAAFEAFNASYTDVPLSVTAVTTGTPCKVTVPGHYFTAGVDYVTTSALPGITGCTGTYLVSAVVGTLVSLTGTTATGTYTTGGTAALTSNGGIVGAAIGTCNTGSTADSTTCYYPITLPAHARANGWLSFDMDTSNEFIESFGITPVLGDQGCGFGLVGIRVNGVCTYPGANGLQSQYALVSQQGVLALMNATGGNYACLGYNPYSGSFGYNSYHAFCSGSNIDGANRHVLSLRCIYLGSCTTQLAMDSHGYLQMNQVTLASLVTADGFNSAMVYVVDASPNTSPCTSGTGAWAFQRQGTFIWDCPPITAVSTGGPISGTTGTFSSTLNVAGATTLSSTLNSGAITAPSVSLSGNAGIGGTLTVFGSAIIAVGSYANNAAAVAAGLPVGTLYRLGVSDFVGIVH